MSIRRLSLLYLAYGFALGFLLPWNVPRLVDAGLPPAGIGLVLGIASLAALIGYPLWGLVADLLLGRDRTLMLSGLLSAVAGVGLMLSAGRPELLSAFVVLAVLLSAPWQPVSDAIALTTLGSHPRAYGRVRVWSSVSWAVGTLLAGMLYVVAGPRWVEATFVVSALGVTAVLAARRPRRSLIRRTDRPPGGRLTWTSLRAALHASPIFLPFLFVLFLQGTSQSAAWSFVSLRILDSGGGPMFIALAAAVPAFAEIVVFSSFGRLAERFGLRVLFAAGCLLTATQLVVIALVPQPSVIAAIRLIDGAGNALRYGSIVLITGAAMPERLRATGQSLAWLVFGGISPIVAGPVGGVIYGSLGGSALFIAAAATITAAAALALVVLAPLARGATAGPDVPAVDPVRAD